MDDQTWLFKQSTIDLIEDFLIEIKEKRTDLNKELKDWRKEADWKGGRGGRIKFGQLNCAKSQHAMDHLLRKLDIDGTPLDILLLSEPPVNLKKNTIKCENRRARVYHHQTLEENGEKRFWAAIIALNDNLDISFKAEWATPFVVSIMVKLDHKKEVKITSVYNRTDSPEAGEMIASSLHARKTLAIMGGDFNVHLEKWNKDYKAKGKEDELLKEALNNPAWKIINLIGSHTREAMGKSNQNNTTIDYSLVTLDMVDAITNWRATKIPRTDHLLLTFDLDCASVQALPAPFPPSNALIARKLAPQMDKLTSLTLLMEAVKNTKEELLARKSKQRGERVDEATREELNQIRKNIRHLEEEKKKNNQYKKTIERDIRRWRKKKEKLIETWEEKNALKIEEELKKEGKRNPWKKAPVGKNTPTQLCAVEKEGRIESNRERMASMIMEALHEDQPKECSYWNKEQTIKNVQGEDLTKEEFTSAVHSLKNNKASGLDGSAIKLVKILTAEWSDKFYDWYKQIYQSGNIPDSWKVTKLIAVAKRQSYCPKVSEFRPIGVSSAWAKIYEKIEANRILYWAEKRNLFLKCQTGFLSGFNTMDAWTNIMDFLRKRKENGSFSKKIIAKIDIEGAFDNVKPEDILNVLVKEKFPAQTINNIATYIIGRTNTLKMGEAMISRPKNKGTVQGAIFSPLLFNILIANCLKDFPEEMDRKASEWKLNAFISIYADDIIIIVEHKSEGDWCNDGKNLIFAMNHFIEMLKDRLNTIHLKVSSEKTRCTFWPSNCFLKKYEPEEDEQGKSFEMADSLRILGITINPASLSATASTCFDAHVRKKIIEGKRTLYSLINNRRGSTKWKKLIVKGTIYQSILYGASIWSQHISRTVLEELENLAWRCIRHIAGCSNDTPRRAVSIVADLPPFHVELQGHCTRNTYRELGIIRERNWVPPPPKKWSLKRLNPANFPSFNLLDDIHSEEEIPVLEDKEAHIYTDAALNKDGAGLAALNYRQNKAILFKTGKWTNPFELETNAILLALKNLDKLIDQETDTVTFFTDSKATVGAIKNRENTHYAINEIRQLITQNMEGKQRTLRLAWVKGHVDIIGNQAADLLATVAIKIGTPIHLPCTTGVIERIVREENDRTWKEWFESKDSDSLASFFPTLELAQKHLKGQKNKTLFFSSSLEWMRVYANELKKRGRYKNKEDPIFKDEYCECDGSSVQNAWHLIFLCPLFEIERQKTKEWLELQADTVDRWTNEGTRDDSFYNFIFTMMPIIEGNITTIREQLTLNKGNRDREA